MHTLEMISSHPQVHGNVNELLIQCIDACHDCAQSCTACADACLAETSVADLTQCIRVNLDCADLCLVTATLASRRTGGNQVVLKHAIESCAAACRVCGEECARHASRHEHCRICAEACRRCLQACHRAADSIGSTIQ